MKGVFCLLLAISVVAIDFDTLYDDVDRIATESPIPTESMIPNTTESPTITTIQIPNTTESPAIMQPTTTNSPTTTTTTTTTTIGTFTLLTTEQNKGWDEERFWDKFDGLLTKKFKEWQEEQARQTSETTTTGTTAETTIGTTTGSSNDVDWFEDFPEDFPGLPQFPEENEISDGREDESTILTFFR